MGWAVLANQFLAGLHPDLQLKGKLAGQEGTFDQLLARARFEEAKLCDFGWDSGRRSGVRFAERYISIVCRYQLSAVKVEYGLACRSVSVSIAFLMCFPTC